MAKLTVKQDAFVKEYIINGGNATQAAITAGYSKKTAKEQGYRLFTNVHITEAIALNQEKLDDVFIVTGEKKLQVLAEVIDRCMGEKKSFDPNNVIKAVNEINKMDGGHASVKQSHELGEGLVLNMNYGPKPKSS